MKLWRNILVVLTALLLAGWVKAPWEERTQSAFERDGLLWRPLEVGVREKIGQTCAAVSLGGLRTVVATFLNLAAYGSFENRDWVKLTDQFSLIVALQPRTSYYWDVGAWHMAYNAAMDCKEREDWPAARQEASHRAYVLKGRAFLERGVLNNPDDWTLLSSLGRFYGTPQKYPDYAKSAEAYEKAWKTGKARNFEARAWLYSLARVEGRQNDALLLARQLFERDRNRVDTLCCLLFVLEWSQPNAPATLDLVKRCFEDESQALRMLSIYKQNNAELLPTAGVDHAISLLQARASSR
ncbi:MAG: hypothetical protein RI957_1967 [Verrucomicrobiota bacterium]|jgi:hypothetical protein